MGRLILESSSQVLRCPRYAPWIASKPRWLVRHGRFWIVLVPPMISSAQGCLTFSAFIATNPRTVRGTVHHTTLCMSSNLPEAVGRLVP